MEPKIIKQQQHHINQKHIDPDALEVIFRLQQEGHKAYLVGGGVRDLLLQKTPKDFDISTSAKPEEIKHIFGRRCLLIGKRFRLAHIRYGQKVFEVSTFRAGDIETSSLILQDNRWGSAEEDVLRRDFTINALFYEPTTHEVLDYVDGYQDIQDKLLRTVGEARLRFKQDPVRMIRLLKFHARFGFAIDHKCEVALKQCKEEIVKSAPARILEEFLKMLESGSSCPFFTLCHRYDFLEILFPCFHHFFSGPAAEIALNYLRAIDDAQKTENAPLDRGLLVAALVFPILEQELITLTDDRQGPLTFGEIVNLSHSLFRGISTSSFTHFPKKMVTTAHFISVLQYRLAPLKGQPRFNSRFPSHDDFVLALQFLKLRSILHPELKELYTAWKQARGH